MEVFLRLFGIDDNDLIPYKEKDFKIDNTESILEDWFENNPVAVFEDEKVFIIGRQVTTNLGKSIDLLGLDKNGNVIIIELKREKTPRETVAQILEYASYVEELNYEELEQIASQYFSEEGFNLIEKHKNFFKIGTETPVAFNKEQRLIIVGQDITKEIEQTATFLNKKGLEVNCLEFKYFKTKSGKQIITSDFVIKKDKVLEGVKSGSKPKINKEIFKKNIDDYLKNFFNKIFDIAEKNKMPIHWGAAGFSLNVDLDGNHVNILHAFSKKAIDGQSIYTTVEAIRRKVNNAEGIINEYFDRLNNTDLFEPAGNEIKWVFKGTEDIEKARRIIDVIIYINETIIKKGLQE